jgi:hypothetical protein
MRVLIVGSILGVLSAPVWGGQAHDVRGWNPQTDAIDVIDAKCKNCHNRQRVDTAIKDKQDMQEVLRKMEQKGVQLTAKEKEVLGVFWKSPFKKTAK